MEQIKFEYIIIYIKNPKINKQMVKKKKNIIRRNCKNAF